MIKRQLEAFGEKFDSEASKVRFRSKEYSCPFDLRIEICDKPNRTNEKYGNCSACLGNKNRIICPRRFYEDNFRILRDIRDFVFGNTTCVSAYDEVKLSKTVKDNRFDYGNLDWILVSTMNENKFIGVEVQADATTSTGSFKEAINDLLNNKLKEKYNFGLNTLASFKGFLPQFMFKGQLFDEWNLPYVAVMQDEMWEEFISKFKIKHHEITKYSTETFMFFIYSLNESNNKYNIKKSKIMATRWIDILSSFAVEDDMLLSYQDAMKIIQIKMKKYKPISTF
jgi:hypothetical protein